MNYVYRIKVKPSAYGSGWDVEVHHNNGTMRLTNYAFRVTAAAAARRLAKKHLAEQGNNKRLEVVVYDLLGRTSRVNTYGRDPRSRP